VIVGGGREAVISTDPLGGANTWRSVTIDAQPCPSPSVGCGGPEAFPSVLDVACPTENTCIAVDVAGYVLSSDSPGTDRGPWRAAHLTSTNGTCGHVLPCAIALNAIACPSSTTCLASDVDGNAFVSRAPTDGAPAWTGRRFSGAIHTAGDVACASLSRCFVTALQEIYERRDGPRRAAWTGTSLPHELTAVACLDRVRCLAGDDHGRISVGRAGPTAAQLRARLRAGLSAARRRTPSMRLTAPVPGTVQVGWRHRGRLVATGATAFDRPGTTRIRLTPMRAGRRLLRRRGPIRLAVRATLVRPLRADVTVRRVQALR
jgi:hypothetical protein